MINKLKTILLSIACLSGYAYGTAGTIAATVNLSPTTGKVEQRIGSSLVVTQSNGNSLFATYIREFKPQVWVTNTGSSVTSFAFSAPPYGSSLAGQTNIFGGSLTLPMSWIFHAPSMYPSAGSLAMGTQTYSVGGQMTMSDGSIVYPTAATITVQRLTLPSSQVSGWNN